MIVAPKSGRNVFGGFAQDDGVSSYREICGVPAVLIRSYPGTLRGMTGYLLTARVAGVPAVLIRSYPDTLRRLEKVVGA